MSTPEAVTELVAAPLAALDLVVEDVTITPAGARRVVRIAVDRALPPATGPVTEAPAPVDLDAIPSLSDAMSPAVTDYPFTVDLRRFPGVDRVATAPDEFATAPAEGDPSAKPDASPLPGEPIMETAAEGAFARADVSESTDVDAPEA